MYMFIYQITCNNQLYIGSTNNLKNRIRQHRYNCTKITNKKYNLPLYKYIRENGGFENIKIEILKIFDSKNLEDQKKEEQIFIEKIKPKLNTHSSYQDIKEKKIYDNIRYEFEKVLCPCCNTLKGKYNIKKHKLTKKYIQYINAQSNRSVEKE